MPLAEWLARGWLTAHQTSKDEVAGLLALIARDLENSQIPGVHADWRFQIAYNAGLRQLKDILQDDLLRQCTWQEIGISSTSVIPWC